ncbi:MAG: HepT-like ribonuclease domain-containing protein [bacterium]
MINKEFVKNKINFIQEELENLAKYKNYSFEEIVSDYIKHAVTERILERIINDAIDINQHIISESEKTKIPADYTETFLALFELEVFPKNFADVVSKSVGLRNILIHHYRELDEKLFYKSIKACLRDYTKYCDYVLKFLKSQKP